MRIEEFKAAVGKYPTGVTVVSTKYNNKFYGFTANSFTSVSLEPALISFCLSIKAVSFDAFLNTRNFVVNVLSNNQADIAVRFASSVPNKFQNIECTCRMMFNGLNCETFNLLEAESNLK